MALKWKKILEILDFFVIIALGGDDNGNQAEKSFFIFL